LGSIQQTLSSDRYIADAIRCRAGAIIVDRYIREIAQPQLVCANVEAALIQALELFAPSLEPAPVGIHPTAVIASSACLGREVSVGPWVVIDEEAVIGDQTILGAGCRIGQGTTIGRASRLDGNVVVYHHCRIGDRVIIQAGTVIGAVGFGYAFIDGAYRLIPHNGGVIIEDYVEIGANCCIDRAKFAHTVVGAGTKIDNLVQIGHNVVLGKCCLLAGQVGIAGSTRLEDGVVLGGQVGIADNLVIGARARVAAQSGVSADVPEGRTMMWSPAFEHMRVRRALVEVMRLSKTVQRIKQMAKRLDRLEAAGVPSRQENGHVLVRAGDVGD